MGRSFLSRCQCVFTFRRSVALRERGARNRSARSATRWSRRRLAAAKRADGRRRLRPPAAGTRSSAPAHPSASACGRQSASSESSISRTGTRDRAAGSISRASIPSRAARKRFSASTSAPAPPMRALPRARGARATGSARPAERHPRPSTERPSPAPRRSRAPAAAARPTRRSSDRVWPPRRSARRPPRRSRRSRRRTAAGPVRGKAWKISVRADANPLSRPCQNGELADSASRTGMWRRRPFSSRIASSASGTPTCTCSAIVGSAGASDAQRVVEQRGSARRSRPPSRR